MITVYYDGKCGLCRREIEHYQRIAPTDLFTWHDITINPSSIEQIGVSYVDGLKFLHAQDSNGTIHVGVDAFLVIWQHLPHWRLMALVVRNPLLRPLANAVYKVFAEWRFNRLSHCKLAITNNNEGRKKEQQRMSTTLDYIHHVAIQVNHIEESVNWYLSHFACEIAYQDATWALLKFNNMSVALVLPNQHPAHFAITRDDITPYGVPMPHRDGTSSVYIQDPSGNNVEMLKLAETHAK